MLLDIYRPSRTEMAAIPAVSKALVHHRYQARRFKFTDEVVAAMARLLRDFPNAFLDNYQFALPTYRTCYVEYNLQLFLKELGSPTTGDLPKYALTEGDKYVGHLIHDYQITSLVQGEKGGAPLASTIGYTYVEHKPLGGFKPFWFNSNLLLAFILGSTLTNNRSTLTDERADDLLHRVRPYFDLKVAQSKPKTLISLLQGAVGEPRNFMAMLLWLNQPKTLHVSDEVISRGWFNSKPVAYAAHHVVRLKPEVTYRTIVKAFAPRRSPRRHEVQEFFRNYDKTNCLHAWPILPDEQGRWKCTKCPQWRIRIKEYMRGDASIGFVTKEYVA